MFIIMEWSKHSCAWQLRDLKFTIYKFMIKLYIRGNFIDQLSVFLFPEYTVQPNSTRYRRYCGQ
jgi:hypothetical protein